MILHLNSFFPILLLFHALIFTNFMHCDGAKKHHKRAIATMPMMMTTEAVNESNGTSAEPEAEEEEEEAEEPVEPDLTVFNDKYLERINDFLENGPLHKHEVRSMLSKLGKIALFLRLYRSSITSPTTGHRGFDQYFPQPSVRFHPEVYDNCTNKDEGDWIDFKYCVDTIFESVQQRAKFIFPVKGQPTQDEILLEEEDFARRVSNSKFSFDMSASYLLCFLTKRNLTAFRRLPFCSYGTEPHQSNKWPAGPFRQYCDAPVYKFKTKEDMF